MPRTPTQVTKEQTMIYKIFDAMVVFGVGLLVWLFACVTQAIFYNPMGFLILFLCLLIAFVAFFLKNV